MWEEHKMYGDEASVFYNDKKHWYKVTDPAKGWKRQFVKSTTSFTKGMPWSLGPLMGWTAKVVAADFRSRLKSGVVYDEVELNEMMRESKKSRYKALDKAGDIGTLVHEFCETFTLWKLGLGEKPVAPDNEEARTSLKQFWQWYKDTAPEFLWSEKKVYSRDGEYVGTADFGRRANGKLILGDYKSSSGIRLDYWMQLAAYAKAYEEMTGEHVDGMEIIWIPKDGEPYQAPLKLNIDYYYEAFEHAKWLHLFAKDEGEG